MVTIPGLAAKQTIEELRNIYEELAPHCDGKELTYQGFVRELLKDNGIEDHSYHLWLMYCHCAIALARL